MKGPKFSIYHFFSLLILGLLSSCDFEAREAPRIVGIDFSQSENDAGYTISQLEEVLNKNPNLKVMKRFDEPDEGISIIYFGNPNLGSPLMQENQRIGLDLPQRMLAYGDGETGSYLLYNSAGFLATSYGLKSHKNFQVIENGLRNINSTVTGNSPKTMLVTNFGANKGVKNLKSTMDFRSTYQALLDRVNSKEYEIFLELDHGSNARKNGFEIRNTRLIMVRDKEMVHSLVKEDPSILVDLWPLKFLVWEDENERVRVSYHRLEFHFERRKLNLNTRAFLELKRMQSEILAVIKNAPLKTVNEDVSS